LQMKRVTSLANIGTRCTSRRPPLCEPFPGLRHPKTYRGMRIRQACAARRSSQKRSSMSTQTSPQSKAAKTNVRDGFAPEDVKNLSSVLNALLADVFALYLKTKNFHWHMSGSHFRDYHLLLDEQASQIFAISDDIAERVRKIGGTTIRSIGHISR